MARRAKTIGVGTVSASSTPAERTDQCFGDGSDERGGYHGGVLWRQFSRAHTVLDGFGEDVAKSPAELQAQFFDFRVDRLGEQRICASRRLERAAGEGLDHGGGALGGAAVRGSLAHHLDLAGDDGAEQFDDQPRLSVEVVVDGAGCDTCSGRDGGHRAGGITMLGEQICGGQQDRAALRVQPRLDLRRASVSHAKQ